MITLFVPWSIKMVLFLDITFFFFPNLLTVVFRGSHGEYNSAAEGGCWRGLCDVAKVCRPQHSWYFGLDSSGLWGALLCVVQWASNMPGLCKPDASCILTSGWDDHCSLRHKIIPCWNLSSDFKVINFLPSTECKVETGNNLSSSPCAAFYSHQLHIQAGGLLCVLPPSGLPVSPPMRTLFPLHPLLTFIRWCAFYTPPTPSPH